MDEIEIIRELEKPVKSSDNIDQLFKRGTISEKCKRNIKRILKEQVTEIKRIQKIAFKNGLSVTVSIADAQIKTIYGLMPSLAYEIEE
jgi:hypothetical protein